MRWFMKTKDKKFDAMQMMRKIREKLSQKYREDPESEGKNSRR